MISSNYRYNQRGIVELLEGCFSIIFLVVLISSCFHFGSGEDNGLSQEVNSLKREVQTLKEKIAFTKRQIIDFSNSVKNVGFYEKQLKKLENDVEKLKIYKKQLENSLFNRILFFIKLFSYIIVSFLFLYWLFKNYVKLKKREFLKRPIFVNYQGLDIEKDLREMESYFLNIEKSIFELKNYLILSEWEDKLLSFQENINNLLKKYIEFSAERELHLRTMKLIKDKIWKYKQNLQIISLKLEELFLKDMEGGDLDLKDELEEIKFITESLK